MKAHRLIIRGGLLAVSLSTALAVNAAEVQWLQAASKDLVADQLVRSADQAPLSATANRNRELVEFQWPLEAGAPITSADNGSQNDSRQYWLDVTAAELNRGITLHTTNSGALIRVSPFDSNSKTALQQDAIRLSQNGRALDNRTSISTFADSRQLQTSGAPFADGTIAFRLSDSVAAGDVVLAVDNRAASDAAYVVHVFEPQSPVVATVRTAHSSHLAGNTINATLDVSGANGSVEGFLLSPDGKTSIPLNFRRSGGQFQLSIAAPQNQGLGLWELHTHFAGATQKGQQVLRDVKTAINITAPTARLSENARLISDGSAKGGQLALQLDVEVAAEGRYQLSGVLYGTAKDGSQTPVALAQSAQWLETGVHSLPLSFDVTNAGVSAPFEIRDLRLQDQSRLGSLHRQARALMIR